MTDIMMAHVLDDIPFNPDVQWLMKRLHIKEGSAKQNELQQVLDMAQPLARPRALYIVASINQKSDDWVEINRIRFNSKVLRINLDNLYRVFPYVATCGPELQEWANGIDDMLLNYWAETVKEAALFCAIQALADDMDARYRPGHVASMNPGSLQDWPIQQQVPLFQLFGDYTQKIGVQLTGSLLMIPTKTVSGIRFTTEADFESCQLCPRDGCPGRRAVYDPELYESRYCMQNGLPKEALQ